MVDKICKCGHLEKDHQYMDKTPEELLEYFIRIGNYTPVYHSDQVKPLGFRMESGLFVFYGEMLERIAYRKLKNSYCLKKRFFKGCKCLAFEADNLKTLEKAYERKAS